MPYFMNVPYIRLQKYYILTDCSVRLAVVKSYHCRVISTIISCFEAAMEMLREAIRKKWLPLTQRIDSDSSDYRFWIKILFEFRIQRGIGMNSSKHS